MRAFALHRGAEQEDLVGTVLCQDVRGHRNEIVFRKGHALRAADIPLLRESVWSEIHLLELAPDDLGQRLGGERLAKSLASAGLEVAPAGHRHVLKATHNGLLKIDTAALQRLNSIAGVSVFTLLDNHAVAKHQVVVEAQITPLAIDESLIEQAERIAGDGSVIRILPFVPRDAVVWMRDERMLRPLTEKLRWFGCSVREVVALSRDARSIRQSMERAAQSGATLFLVSGSNALDPLDPVFAALEQISATIQRVGMPVHPGTLLWIASWQDITMVGLPSCGLGTQLTAFDLVLPRLLAMGEIREEEIAALGHGGILQKRPRVVSSGEGRAQSTVEAGAVADDSMEQRDARDGLKPVPR